MPRTDPTREQTRFAFAPDLAGMEMLTANYWAHRFAPHVHDTYVIALIERGAEQFRCNGVDCLAPAGSVVLVPPGALHTGQRGCEAGWSYRVFYPTPQLLGALMAEWRDGADAPPVFGSMVLHDPPLFQAFRRLHLLLHNDACALRRASAWRTAMGALLLRHARLAPRRLGRETSAVRRAQDLLRADAGATLGLADLASAVGLSPWYLNRVFARDVGLPPHAWRNQWRLAQAKTLLRHGQATAEIAAALGFADQAHLHRHFKRAFGVTPGVYRSECSGQCVLSGGE
jgi:AraC-like DNA-binding protein